MNFIFEWSLHHFFTQHKEFSNTYIFIFMENMCPCNMLDGNANDLWLICTLKNSCDIHLAMLLILNLKQITLLTATPKVNSPLTHLSPWNPAPHPCRQLPLTWWHWVTLIQGPHGLPQSCPYVPLSHTLQNNW